MLPGHGHANPDIHHQPTNNVHNVPEDPRQALSGQNLASQFGTMSLLEGATGQDTMAMPFSGHYQTYHGIPTAPHQPAYPHPPLPHLMHQPYSIDVQQGGPFPPHFQQQPPYRPPPPRPMPSVNLPPSAWSSPPMSPAIPYYPAHGRHRSFADDLPGMIQGFAPPSAFLPHRPPPNMASAQSPRHPNRRSWSGPPRESDRERERKAYHPQAPAHRSDWVMWVGNVPQNTSHEELWRFFNKEIPSASEPWRGPASIFLISRSSCAFVNLSSQEDLDKAVSFFNNRSLRPWDPRCPRLVCRVRRKDDDLRAGVGAQRGTGMHRDWVKQKQQDTQQQDPPVVEPALDTPISPLTSAGEANPIDVKQVSKHQSSASYASTNSSFLTKNFPRRVFILKSSTRSELEESVKTGKWRTQKHNEPILDQAFRTSSEVFLIFSANRTGEFFGFAKMIEHINKEKFSRPSQSSKGSNTRIEQIIEEGGDDDRDRASSEPLRPSLVLPPSQTRIAASSPSELTPGEVAQTQDAENKANTDPVKIKPQPEASPRSKTMFAKSGYFPSPDDGLLPEHALEVEEKGDGVLRRDTLDQTAADQPVVPPTADAADAGEELGREFAIQWIKYAPLPFARTRHLKNPWNADREVKISRDGTELEPVVGALLMAEWDKIPSVTPSAPVAEDMPTYASVNRE